MYSQDFDENLCPDKLGSTVQLVWDQLIQPYAKNQQIFVCPDWAVVTNNAATGRVLTYGMNYRLTQFDPGNLNDANSLWFATGTLSQLRTPAQTFWIMDNAKVTNPSAQPLHQEDPTKWILNHSTAAGSGWNSDGYTRFPQDPPNSGYVTSSYYGDPWHPAPIHNGGTNTSYCDGHAKWIRTDQMVNPPRGSVNCYYDNGSP